MRVKSLLILICFILMPQMSVAYGELDAFSNSLQECKQLEARGQWYQAGQSYYNLLMNQVAGAPCVGQIQMPLEFKTATMRRAIACMTRAANQGSGAEKAQAQGSLYNLYATIHKMEPSNPTWGFLMAQCLCSTGSYLEADSVLQSTIRTGGSPTVLAKARALKGHIAPFLGADQARVTAEANAPGVRRNLGRPPDLRGLARMPRQMTPEAAQRHALGQRTYSDMVNGW